MAHDVEGKFDFVAHAYQSVRGESRFDFEVATIDAEFALCPQVASGDRHRCRNCNRPGYSV